MKKYIKNAGSKIKKALAFAAIAGASAAQAATPAYMEPLETAIEDGLLSMTALFTVGIGVTGGFILWRIVKRAGNAAGSR